ncbi:hypothetical protein LCGC14_2547380 [marine sediment metagenome]|uniref:Phospholipase C/D domain-containing protein n=1 Tax=marine sediment metagenome TaxID=412755 RepID=A0A0F9D0C6_9ZZZZ
MKELVHRECGYLVGTYGSVKINLSTIDTLVKSSVEPDKLNKEEIRKDLFNLLTIPMEWLINHTIRAKTLAIRCLWEAHQLHRIGDSNWVRILGWAYHYIADWATPHHSPTSNANQVPILMGLGSILGGFLGGIARSSGSLEDTLKGIAQGALVGTTILGGVGIIGLIIDHSEFEDICDIRWVKNVDLIKQRFITQTENQILHISFEENLSLFDLKMNDLRNECNALSSDWIHSSNSLTFAEYMVNIALLIDFATLFVTTC